MGETLDRA